MQSEEKKAELYRWIRVGGLLSVIPLILAAGPMAGYAAGRFIADRFHLPALVVFTFAAIGFATSIKETVRIIRFALKNARDR